MACHKNSFILLNTPRVMRTFAFCIYENIDADYLCGGHKVELYIVQLFYFLIPKFQTYGHVLWAYSPVCVGSWCEILKTGFVTTWLIYQPCFQFV